MPGALKYTTDGSTWNTLVGGPQGAPGPTGPMGPAGVSGTPGLPEGRNRIINGSFAINQRAFTSAVPGANQMYSADRWRTVANGDGTVTFALYGAPPGELPESAPAYYRVDTAGQTQAGCRAALFQQIEDVRTLSGKTVTVSFWARGSVGLPYVGVELRQSIAAGGTGTTTQSKKVQLQPVLWPQMARYSVTIPVPSLAGKTLGDVNDHLQLLLWTSAGSDYAARSDSTPIQNGIIDFWGVQVEEGTSASAYESKSYAEDLRECQRYFQRWKQPPLRGACGGGAAVGRMGMPLPVTMRVAPGATLGGNLPIYNGITTGEINGITANYSKPDLAEIDTSCTAAFGAAGQIAVVYQAGANYLDLSAEF